MKCENGKFEEIGRITVPTWFGYKHAVKEARRNKSSVAISCSEWKECAHVIGDPYAQCPFSIFLDGHVVKEQSIRAVCGDGGKDDHVWESTFYSQGRGETGLVFYKDNTLRLEASFDTYPSAGRLDTFCVFFPNEPSIDGSPIIYCNAIEDIAKRYVPGGNGKICHYNPDPKLVQELGMALSNLDYVPEDMLELLANIVKGKETFEKNRETYSAFYEYLLGARAKEYI